MPIMGGDGFHGGTQCGGKEGGDGGVGWPCTLIPLGISKQRFSFVASMHHVSNDPSTLCLWALAMVGIGRFFHYKKGI